MDCLNIYSLDGCYYSQSLEELLNNKKIKYNLNRVNLEVPEFSQIMSDGSVA